MQLDFKQDSQKFALENGCPPAAIICKAMEHGASVAIVQLTEIIRGLRAELKSAQINGRSNGETKVIASMKSGQKYFRPDNRGKRISDGRDKAAPLPADKPMPPHRWTRKRNIRRFAGVAGSKSGWIKTRCFTISEACAAPQRDAERIFH